MKSSVSTFLLCAALAGCASTAGEGRIAADYVVDAADEAAVLAAMESYIDGFYEGEPAHLERALSPDLVKLGFRRSAPDEPFGEPMPMTYAEALALAAQIGEGDAAPRDQSATKVEILELADKMAAGKITAFWGIDYVHLVKEDGAWRIRHVIWQSEPALAGD
ncbi:MAG: nuclear transport factor 2 family protein [Planctomycetota bacterium]|nr:nuclear transport factor 2 family protein [Planctomycetota bacterium]